MGMNLLITQSSSHGEVVIDPFLGSGSTGVAAVRNGRCFAGCDSTNKPTLSRREANATPIPFRDMLVALARSCGGAS